MKKLLFFIGVFALGMGQSLYAQEEQNAEAIDYTSERTLKNEESYPGALIMYKVNNQVTFTHKGIKVWSDQAIFYKKDNFFRASGHVKMKQGDTITLTSGYAEYDGSTEFAFASNDVILKTPSTTLNTDSLFFDRQRQEAFYRSGGVVRDSASTITSTIGRYYTKPKKYTFRNNVVVTNKNYVIHSDHIDFYTKTGKIYLYGPSTITGDSTKIYCERGFYDTHKDYGYFIKDATIYYKNRKMQGDSIYFNRNTHFASATNNIKITDTANASIARGHYAEVYREKDSVFITKRALVIKAQEKDSIYIHSDTIMITGKPENRIIRAYYDARIYKNDLNGRSDSIFASQKTGITKMLGNPVLFSGRIQLTGDTIELFSDTITNKLDSLSVHNNAFLIQEDTIGGFNQVKGKFMYGLFKDNKLDLVHFIKNTETIYYYRDEDDGSLTTINKGIASSITINFDDGKIRSISYNQNPETTSYIPSDFPKNARELRGFNWRGEERLLSKYDLFKGEPPLDLPKIKGIPLPEKTLFFAPSRKKGALPFLNEKSRLNPELLVPRKKDSSSIGMDHFEIQTDSIPTR